MHFRQYIAGIKHSLLTVFIPFHLSKMVEFMCKEGDAWLNSIKDGGERHIEANAYPRLNDPSALMEALQMSNSHQIEVIYDLWSGKFKNPDDVTTQDLVDVWKSEFPGLTFEKDLETEHVVVCFFQLRRIYLVPIYHY